MKLATTARILATGLTLLVLVVDVAAKDPIFVKWLIVDDPTDETIRTYWQQAEAGALGPRELVDLGTMLFYRGWSNDAVEYFKQALDADPQLADAWFRIGLVKHHAGDLSSARSAYKKCLKIQSGHAWGNFYLGLLEEQTGDAKAAMEYYERAFKHAPALADPRINPEILSSELQLGAQVRHHDRQGFQRAMPMAYLEPEKMREVQATFLATPTPIPTPVPTIGPRRVRTPAPAEGSGGTQTRGSGTAAGVTAGAAAGSRPAGGTVGPGGGTASGEPDPGSTPYGFPTPPPGQGSPETSGAVGGPAPQLGDTSPDASLAPIWPGLYELIDAIV